MDPNINSYSDSQLDYLRDWRKRFGLPTDEIENEIARRESTRILRQAAPAVTQAKVDAVKSDAAYHQARADKYALQADPNNYDREMKVKESRVATDQSREARLTQQAADLSDYREKMLKLRTDKQKNDIDLAKAKQGSKEQQNALKLRMDLLKGELSVSEAAANRAKQFRTTAAVTLSRLNTATDEKDKALLRDEYNNLIEQAKQAETDSEAAAREANDHQRVLMQYLGAAGVQQAATQPAMPPTSQPATQPATQPAMPQPTTQPAAQPTQTQSLRPEIQQAVNTDVQKARAGDSGAKRRLRRIREAANRGEPDAQAALALIGDADQ